MALKDRKITEAGIAQHGVVSAPDRLTGTVVENKKMFDRLVRNVVAEQVNGLVDDLSAKTAGASGISQLGMTPIAGLNAANAQAALEELKNWLEQAIIGAGGVLSYNGRRGAVKPQSGDYTAEMVGAAPVLDASKTLYVSPDGSDTTGDGSAEKPYRQIQKALGTLPKNLGYNTVTINVAAGEYTSFDVQGFYGGRSNKGGIYILGESQDTTTITGAVAVWQCSTCVDILNLHFTGAFVSYVNRFVRMGHCTSDGTASTYGIHIYATNSATLNNVTVSDKTDCGIAIDGSTAFLGGVGGKNNNIGLKCGNSSSGYGGIAVLHGHTLTGTTPISKMKGGVVFSEGNLV